MNKKQLLFYTPGLYPCKTGGMEIYNHFLLKNLPSPSPNIEIKILTACEESIKKGDNYFPLKERSFFFRRKGLGALSTIVFYLFSKKIQWGKLDIIFIPYTSNFGYSSIAFLLLKKFFKVDYVIHIHGGGMKLWKPFWLQSKFFKTAKNIAGVSWPIVKEYSKRCDQKIEYLPPLLPFEKNKKNKKELKKKMGYEDFNTIILFVGSLKPLKSPDTLLKAFNKLNKDFIAKEKIGLIFVGEGPLKIELQNFAIENSIDKYVNFTGKIANEKISEYYAVTDIYVIPSWIEGTPIALLEAMFNGLLCIGTDVKGIADLIENKKNGILVEKNNYFELSRVIRKYILEKNLRISLGSKARNYYKKSFNYNDHLEQVSKFIIE